MVKRTPLGTQLGGYDLREFLKEDVAGQLYRAEHSQTGQQVLLKVVSPSVCQNPVFRRYFFHKSADRQAMVEHPNVVQVLDVGQEQGVYYVALEAGEGRQLAELMAEGPTEPIEGLNIVRQIAEGLRGAHRRDVVHGHLKPADVLLTTDQMGRLLVKVSLLDLGITSTDSVVSVFGEVMGAPKYMAPEVIRGRQPDAQADVFALGVLAYELFTGREPFASDHAVGYLFANCEKDAARADEVNADVPREVAQIIHRMMEKDPARRHRTMQRVIDDLDRCVQALKTGHVEVVPFGTDSAFARNYEMPEPKAEATDRGASAGRVVATVLLVLVVGALAYVAGRGLPAVSTDPNEGVAVGKRAPLGPPAADLQQVTPPETTPAARRADGGPAAYADAVADWQRYSQKGDYELGLSAFRAVERDHPGTRSAKRSREQRARIHMEWAVALASEGNHAGAVENCDKAVEAAPEGTETARIARARQPVAMVKLAEDLSTRGSYVEAIGIYEQLAERFPGTQEAQLLAARKPVLLMDSAFMQWKDRGELEEALDVLRGVVRDYPGTQFATDAERALPDLYLDMVERDMGTGRLAEARVQLQQLAEVYPDHRVGEKAADYDARILFGLFEQARADEDAAGADTHYAELLDVHGATPWALRGVRMRLGLQRGEDDSYYDVKTARAELRKTQARFDKFDFDGAITALRGVIRCSPDDLPEAAAAISMLPSMMYRAALYGLGRNSRVEFHEQLADLAQQFPGTEWDRKAKETLRRIEQAPDGMVYVPEGRFRMGSSLSELVSVLRAYGGEQFEQDSEYAETFAEVWLLDETPGHVASTGAYYVGRTEVANAQYKDFVDATGHSTPLGWRDGTYPAGEGDLPAVNVTPADAAAYAKWIGGRLPTEAEWEKAARGVDGRRFPWGDLYNAKVCHHMRPRPEGPVAIDSFEGGDSPYGCLNMVGNVREWTASSPAAYPGGAWQPGPEDGHWVVARGGAWVQEDIVPVPTRCATRFRMDPKVLSRADGETTGFRCVIDVGEGGPSADVAAATDAGA